MRRRECVLRAFAEHRRRIDKPGIDCYNGSNTDGIFISVYHITE